MLHHLGRYFGQLGAGRLVGPGRHLGQLGAGRLVGPGLLDQLLQRPPRLGLPRRVQPLPVETSIVAQVRRRP